MRLVNDKVLGHMGDVLAEKIYGQWESKDPTVLQFIADHDKVAVRVRTDEGKFVPDDPTTPEVNEAWTTKLTKKLRKK
jgi:hypothetical protein